ncbi:MAG: tRNA (adenosine(37)-N6)-threonylcarbamoyltransferase complex dimerization subunit type 1 TsaB [Allomuricauda sp.]|nr:MAG: tRNA (adenosine(37)-N6)-threonylcarbamoyltransferase complex dimerization subunit type 1 TsaB [Allomuricauda sp.]
MSKILCLETATTNCSVCVAAAGQVIAIKEENTANYSHAEQLHVFIDDVLEEASLKLSDLDAIAVSKGPGSYTGLRIGVSAAKGLCFSLDIPLISIPTLESMANHVTLPEGAVVIPVLDARRMEVYSAVFDANLNEIRETKAEIIDASSFAAYKTASQVHLVGNGAEKCMAILGENKNFQFDPSLFPSAMEMGRLAHKKFEAGQFEDVAYFEPFYLKDFIIQTKQKS